MTNLREHRRAVEADPRDVAARHRLARARARIEGPAVLLEPLRERALWQATPAPLQDLAIEEARRRLEDRGFHFKETRTWSCPNGEQTVSHRLATFVHEDTGWAMNLLPGDGAQVKPMLVARGAKAPGFQGRPPYLLRERIREDRLLLASNGMRLPSVAEWSHACRAGTETRFYWGEEIDQRHVWIGRNSNNLVRPFAEHEAMGSWNAFGLVDMLGNIWECTRDRDGDGFFACGACFQSGWGTLRNTPRFASSWRYLSVHNLGYRTFAELSGY